MKKTSLKYGQHHAQVADLWRPEGRRADVPVVVLIHGGFWRQLYTKRLMDRMAAAAVAHGWMAYNIEYRRVGMFGGGGWPETFEDVSAAIDALAGVDGIDPQRIVTCGHSAGGQLALWAGSSRSTGKANLSASPPVRVSAAISLAGVVDLAGAARSGVGGGAITSLMEGRPDEYSDRYAMASPTALLPIGIPQLLVHGLADTTVPASMSADYVELARERGDDAKYVPLPGIGHMNIINPSGLAFREIATRLDLLSASRR